jgi:hypothetical protein
MRGFGLRNRPLVAGRNFSSSAGSQAYFGLTVGGIGATIHYAYRSIGKRDASSLAETGDACRGGNPSLAIACYTAALQRDPKLAAAYFGRGKVYFEGGA